MKRRTFLREASGAAAVALAGCGGDPPLPPTASSPPAPSRPPIEILSHYCNWLEKTPGHDNWEYTSQRPLYPSVEGYDSFDETVLDHHDELMRHYGIVPLFSWLGPEGDPRQRYGGDGFLHAWLAGERVAGAILYESESRLQKNRWGWLDFNWPPNQERFVRDMDHLWEELFSRYPARFYRVDGRPVVFLWLSHIYTGRFDEAAARVRDRVYLVGGSWRLFGPGHEDYAHPDHPHRHDFYEYVMQSFDALSGYGLYEGRFVEEAGGELNEQLLGHINQVADDWVAYVSGFHPGQPIWLPLQFTFNDTLVEHPRGNPVLKATLRQAERLAATWRERIDSSLESGGPETTRILHVSFNEFFEGSAVVPFRYSPRSGSYEGYPEGEEYLRILGDVLNEGR
jgi:hypothetical protein